MLPKLSPAIQPKGFVLFGVSRPETVAGVARISVLVSHYYDALPMAVHVAGGKKPTTLLASFVDLEGERLFQLARAETRSLGYPLRTYSEFAPATAEGLRQAVEALLPKALILGYPFARKDPGFTRIVDDVASGTRCPVILARVAGPINLERILVPLKSIKELTQLQPVITALAVSPEQRLTLLYTMPLETDSRELDRANQGLSSTRDSFDLPTQSLCHIVPVASCVDKIVDVARENDLIIMSIDDHLNGIPGNAGPFAEEVTHRLDCPVVLVGGSRKAEP